MREWIPVKEKLPEASGEFLVYPIPNPDMNIISATFQTWDGKWIQDFYNGHDYEDFYPVVTHWAEIPDYPE